MVLMPHLDFSIDDKFEFLKSVNGPPDWHPF